MHFFVNKGLHLVQVTTVGVVIGELSWLASLRHVPPNANTKSTQGKATNGSPSQRSADSLVIFREMLAAIVTCVPVVAKAASLVCVSVVVAHTVATTNFAIVDLALGRASSYAEAVRLIRAKVGLANEVLHRRSACLQRVGVLHTDAGLSAYTYLVEAVAITQQADSE